MHRFRHGRRLTRLLLIPGVGLLLVACGSAGPAVPRASVAAPPSTSGAGGSPAADASGGSTTGDVPDNAVFLTFRGGSPAFAISYVEGWQVTPQAAGVVIRDKDSGETVAIAAPPADLASWITSTDLPALGAQAGFKLVKQDRVTVGGSTYDHLLYSLLSAPDPVTGKQVASLVDRYYVPGAAGLAIVSLSTPDGVDNLDAFRQMIESFTWQ